MLTNSPSTQNAVSSNPLLAPVGDADGRLDRYLAILMSAMANENAGLFEQPEQVEVTFELLEQNVLQEYQAGDLRAAYERVIDAEVALEKSLRAAESLRRDELTTAQAELQAVQDKLASIHADAQSIDAEFAPHYAELQRQEQNVTAKAQELIQKGETLSPENRARFERDVDLALGIQLGKIANARAQLDSERGARRQPYDAQVAALQQMRDEWAQQVNEGETGAGESAQRVQALRRGTAAECVSLREALRELLARRDRFPSLVEPVEAQLGKDACMDAISKRHTPIIKQIRLEMDAPANLAMAREAIARKDMLAAEKFIRAAADGGAAKELIEPLKRQIKTWRRQKEIETALAKIEACAAQPGGWNRAGELQRQYAEEWSRIPALRRRMDQVVTVAKEGIRERGQKLERAVAIMLRREGTEFAAKIKADLGKLTLARRDKKGAWFLVATGLIAENGQVKIEYWTQPKYAEDQVRWNEVWHAQERAREKWAQLAAEIEADEAEMRGAAEMMQAQAEHERAQSAAAMEEENARKRAQKRTRREQKFEQKRERRGTPAGEIDEEEDLETAGDVEVAAENERSEGEISNVWWRIYITKSPAAELVLNRLEQTEPNLIIERLGSNLVESRPGTYSVQVFENPEEIKARFAEVGVDVIDVEEYAA